MASEMPHARKEKLFVLGVSKSRENLRIFIEYRPTLSRHLLTSLPSSHLSAARSRVKLLLRMRREKKYGLPIGVGLRLIINSIAVRTCLLEFGTQQSLHLCPLCHLDARSESLFLGIEELTVSQAAR